MSNIPMGRVATAGTRLIWRLVPYGVAAFAVFLAAAVLAKFYAAQELPRHHPAAWYPVSPSPIPRAEGPGTVVNGKLYIVGGFHTRALEVTSRFDVYDPASDRWSRLSDMPVPNTHMLGAADGDTIWYAGGFIGDHPGRATRAVYKYHVPSDQWTEGPPLPARRAGGGFVRLGRSLHYFSGLSLDRNTNYGEHWVLSLDGDQTWTPRAPLPHPRSHLASVVLDGQIYAIGGQFRHDLNRRDVAFVHRYDPDSDSWTALAPLPFALSHIETSTLVWGGRIYVFGGRSESYKPFVERLKKRYPFSRATAIPDVLAYDPKTDKWEPQPELPTGLLAPVVVNVGDKVILTNGSTMNTYFVQSSTYVACLPLKWHSLRQKDPGC